MNHHVYPPTSAPNHSSHPHQPMPSELAGQPQPPPSHYPGYAQPPHLPAISQTQAPPYYSHGGQPPHMPPASLPNPHMADPRRPPRDVPSSNGSGPVKGEVEDRKAVAPAQSMERDDGVRRFRLVVVQQPIRARMCGFGDKDRRPLSPPPMIRLIVMDKETQEEINIGDIDFQYFTLHCDIWDANGAKEVNLIHNQNNGSISSGSAASFREVMEASPPSHGAPASYGYMPTQPASDTPVYAPPPRAGYPQIPSYPSDPYGPQGFPGFPQPQPPSVAGYPVPAGQPGMPIAPSQQYGYPQPAFRGELPSSMAPVPSQRPYGGGAASQYPSPVPGAGETRPSISGSSSNHLYTRNLIGSVATSASRLNDLDDAPGIWFIPHDMSVRTEGWYRLRFSFLDLRDKNAGPSNGTSDSRHLTRGKAPILATAFSDPFRVFSAKKFPGVVESTELMKCFAKQGVKIPIRGDKDEKEGKGKRKAGDMDYDDFDDDDDD